MDITMEKTTVGEENPYLDIEMESKETDDTVIYDDVAPDDIKGPEKGEKPSIEPRQSCQENFLKLQRMLYIVTAVGIISLLTAAASLALTLSVMNAQNTMDSLRCSADCLNNSSIQGTQGGFVFCGDKSPNRILVWCEVKTRI